MKRYVIDSYALIAYSEAEQGAEKVVQLLTKALFNEAQLFVSVINWGEMYYIALRECGEAKAELFRKTFLKYPLYIIDVDEEITLQAARFKAFYKISYADAFAVALAKQQKAELVTGDKEFKSLKDQIKILWI